MVSQMGSVVLPPATIEKLDRGEALDPDEVSHLAELPVLAERLLSHIPRLEGVRQILRDQALDHMVAAGGHHRTPEQETVRVGAAMLRLAVDLDSLEAAGASRPDALHELRQRAGVYDPDLISALSELPGGEEGPDVVPIGVASLRAGMTLACNVTDVDGRLLVGRGVRVSDGMIELIGKWRLKTAVSEPVYIAVHPPLSGAA
jgi:hypothetical protein